MVKRKLLATDQPFIQLKLDLWGRLAQADRDPIGANLAGLWEAVDESILSLSIDGKLATAGDAILRIANIFSIRSHHTLELVGTIGGVEPVLPIDCFARFVRQSMSVDFERFIQPSGKLFRLANQEPSTVEINLDNREELVANSQTEVSIDFQSLADLAGDDTPAIWSDKITDLLQTLTVANISFSDLSDLLGMEDVEIWLGLLLGSFSIDRISNDFYSRSDLTISIRLDC